MCLWKSGVHHLDFVSDSIINLIPSREINVICERNTTLFCPLGNDIKTDADHCGQKRLLMTKHHHLGDKRGEFKFIFDKLWREAGTARGDSDVADTINDHQMAVLLLEVTGVTGTHPALGINALTGRFSVFVVTAEHPRIASDDLANPVLVRIVDADITSFERDPNAVVIDIIGSMNGVGTSQFGLAINLAQRHPHRKEEFKGIGAKCRTTSGSRLQMTETKTIFERFKYQPISKFRWLTGLFKAVDRPSDRELVDPMFERRGIHHPCLDVGGQ